MGKNSKKIFVLAFCASLLISQSYADEDKLSDINTETTQKKQQTILSQNKQKVAKEPFNEFNDIFEEIEGIENLKNTKFSKIYYSLLMYWNAAGYVCEQKFEDYKILGSRALGGSFFINFPIAKSHFVTSAGISIGKSSFYWDKKQDFLYKSFLDEESTFKVISKQGIEYTKLNFWKTNIEGKILFVLDKFDPKDSFIFGINGGISFVFSPAIEYQYKETYSQGGNYSVKPKTYNITNINFFIGCEAEYNRIGAFYKQYLKNVSNDNVGLKFLPFDLGIYINLL